MTQNPTPEQTELKTEEKPVSKGLGRVCNTVQPHHPDHQLRYGREYVQWLEDSAYTEYKEYPNHIGHWNPQSPDYIPAHREEEWKQKSVDGYNWMITEFKSNIKAQKEVYDMVDSMDRPYLRGVAGIDKNVYEQVQDYSNPIGHDQINYREVHQEVSKADGNLHRWVSNTPWIPNHTKLSNEIQWEMDNDNRPVNDHYNADKGFKFDVMVPYEERAPHVADRLGFPEQLGSPLERLFRLDHDLTHPNYLDQAFVQTPSPYADPTLNFQAGEVIYENPRVAEWTRYSFLSQKIDFGCFQGK
jgi:hypothetical protein